MRALRNANEQTLTETARLSGWSRQRLGNAEEGREAATLEMVEWYEEAFEGLGSLRSFYRMVEAERRARDPRRRRRSDIVLPGEASPDAVSYPADRVVFLGDLTIPDATIVRPGQEFEKTWAIQNGGQTTWSDRWLRRQDSGSDLEALASTDRIKIPDTSPGGSIQLSVRFTTPHTRVAQVALSTWRIADNDGRLFFPDVYTHGCTCVVIVVPDPDFERLITGPATSADRLEVVRVPPRIVVRPREPFFCTWTVRNVGPMSWQGYELERIGPAVAPGTMRSSKRLPLPETGPGATCEIALACWGSGVEGTSTATFRLKSAADHTVTGGPLTCNVVVERIHRHRGVNDST